MIRKSYHNHALRRLVGLLLLLVAQVVAHGQTIVTDSVVTEKLDSVVMEKADSLGALTIEEMEATVDSMLADSLAAPFMDIPSGAVGEALGKTLPKQGRDWSTWRPDPQRALWLALVIPGGGQIYNRKYWKLPIVYGGFVGCIYAMMWNNMMYHDYAQAYLDIMDDDPNTASYNKFLHLGRTIDDTNVERYKKLFKSRKDKYRRWRDLSFFTMLGIYAVSVIDAYVDAELSEFDISKDLSLKVRPTVIGNGLSNNPVYAASLGVNCSIKF